VWSSGEVQGTKRRHEDVESGWDEPYTDDAVPARTSVIGYALAGLTLFAAFGVAGNYLGNNAVAHTAAPTTIDFDDLVSPATSSILGKGSLLDGAAVHLASLGPDQETQTSGKGDYQSAGLIEQPVFTPVNVPETLSIAKLENNFRVGDALKRKVQAQRRFQLAEQDCLARAVYFEARSEPEMGQLAVAKVILNRVKDPNYPKTICGVIYQGANRNNSCQFSFACDGQSDQPTVRASWKQARRVAAKAMAGDRSIEIMTAATHYHADYVTPKWAASFKRVIKIGRHIFYSDS
ncbi:MAG: cell wall hydrolase, partial [Pseudomonadota bacterium]|nr:cell wall hydrolase [Pseudomonadota bacterium]